MSNNETVNPLAGWPRWAGYLTTFLAVAIVTAILDSFESIFPLGRFPIPYVLLVMASAYLFGEGPAALTFILGLVAYIYFFILPVHTFKLPSDVMGWAALTAFLMGMLIVGFATLMMRRARERIHRSAEAARASSERVTLILESITDAFFTLDREWRFTYVNSEAEKLLQRPREELLGKVVWDEFPETVRSEFYVQYQNAVSGRVTVGFEAFYEPLDVWLEVRAYPLPEGLSVYFRDVTERKRAEETLRRYRVLAESTRDIVLFIRHDGRILDVNEAALREYGYTRDELLPMSIYDLRAPGTAATIKQQMQQAEKGGVLFETVHRRKDGSTFPVEVSSQGAVIDGERVLLSIIRNITERVNLRKALELQVTQLQRALLPEDPSIGGGYRIAASYVPGMTDAEIGGDFYDVFETEAGETAVIIGDVSGKGIPAAAQAAATRGALHAFAYDMSSPSEAMSHTNAVLYQHELDTESFVTAMAVLMDLPTGRISYANAAHPPAAVYRFASGAVEFFRFGQAPFGILETQQFENHECVLDPGDRMVLYTDGVSEARRGGDMFGSEGIETVLKEYGERSAQEIIDALLSSARDWAQGHFTDDIAIIVVERPRPEGFPWPPVEGSSVSLPHAAKGA